MPKKSCKCKCPDRRSRQSVIDYNKERARKQAEEQERKEEVKRIAEREEKRWKKYNWF